jgi:hypothetical protein
MPVVSEIFEQSVTAIRDGKLIARPSRTDKEFHFQDWFKARLAELDHPFESGGRNSYPDFRMVEHTEGYELKGLAYPGRDATFDSNSQVPTGLHNGRQIYYVFGRYPKKPDGDTYPVIDLVVCHGDFLNADHDYVHKNKNVKGFGSYGDLMIRDRKMYVVPTPFRLMEGVAHTQTLILPADTSLPKQFACVGELKRQEADQLVVAYSFDLQTNELTPELVENPSAGQIHEFRAWRLKGTPGEQVAMRSEEADVG